MEPTGILSNEHRVIEIVLSVLENMADEAEEKGVLDKEAAETAVDFIRNFADKCHHGKEEDHLFTTLNAKGLPADGGPVGIMLNEHEMGRSYVRVMADNIDTAASGDREAVARFVTGARNYTNLLFAHIKKEDGVLFPMASRILTPEDKRDILKKFDLVEKDHMGEGTHDKYLKIAESLAARFNVTYDKTLLHSCGCGH